MTGGVTNELEKLIADGKGLLGGADSESLKLRRRCKIKQFSVLEASFSTLPVNFI